MLGKLHFLTLPIVLLTSLTAGVLWAADPPAPAVGADVPTLRAGATQPGVRELTEAARLAGRRRNRDQCLAVARQAHELGAQMMREADQVAAKTTRETDAADSAVINKLLVAARQYFELALRLREKWAPASPDLAETYFRLGQTWQANFLGHQPGVIISQEARIRELQEAARYYLLAASGDALPPQRLELLEALVDWGRVGPLVQDKKYAARCEERAFTLAIQLRSVEAGAVLEEAANYFAAAGQPVRMYTYHEATVAAYEAASAPGKVVTFLRAMGLAAHFMGDDIRARDYLQRALVLADQLQFFQDSVYYALARITRDLPTRVAYLERSLTKREKDPVGMWLLNPLNALAQAHLEMGNLVRAEAVLQRAQAHLQQHPEANRGNLYATYALLGKVAHRRGDLATARQRYEQAAGIDPTAWVWQRVYCLTLLAGLLDETGDRDGALARLDEALVIIRSTRAPVEVELPLLRLAARLLLEVGRRNEATAHLRRVAQLEEAERALPPDLPLPGVEVGQITRPEIRFLTPEEGTSVSGNTLTVRAVLLAPKRLHRYRLWLNGRAVGPEAGSPLPAVDEKGRLLDKGEGVKGRLLDKGAILEKGRLLDKGDGREEAGKGLPPDVAALVAQPQFCHSLQLRFQVPVEDTDGEFLRIALVVESEDGNISDRRILPLRRPEAAAQGRGSLRVLAVGINDYQKLPPLQYAAGDATDLGTALKGQTGSGRQYAGADITLLTEGNATLARVRQALAALIINTQPGDTVVVALSGHGIKKGDQTWFAPLGFDPAAPERTGLPWKELLAGLQEVRKTARTVWVLADCCRSAPGFRKELAATARDFRQGVAEGGNLIICTASSGDTPSYESEDLRHGIFTQAWLDVLSGNVPESVKGLYQSTSRGPVITLIALQSLVDFRVTELARKAGVFQRVDFPPGLYGSFSPSQPVFTPVAGGG